jgi:hypothetical protein
MDVLDADIRSRPERRNSPPRCECGVQFGEYRHGGCMGAGHLDAIGWRMKRTTHERQSVGPEQI